MHRLLLCVCFSCSIFWLHAQSTTTLERPSLPLKVAILDESISLPNFWFTRYSYNPTAIVGTEWIWKQNQNHDWHITGNLGFYHHKDWQTAVFLNSELGYRQYIGSFRAVAKVGLGYAHTFANTPVYRYENGDYQEVTDLGNPTFMPSAALQIGYAFRNEPESPEVFLLYMMSGDVPFNIFTGLHQFVGLGLTIYPFSNNSN